MRSTVKKFRASSKEEAKKLAVEFLQIEILDMKGEIRDIALNSYHRLLKATDKPIYLSRRYS